MRHGEFLGIVKELARLNPGQRKQVLDRLASGFAEESLGVSAFLKEPESCPRCGHPHFVFWGTSNGLPRFRCKSCGSAFTVLSGSPLARLSHRDRWLQYAGCLLDGLTIRAAAKECGISIPTSFRWRHRFLAMIELMKPTALQGIVEADETFFLDSKKGDRHLGRKARRRGGKAKKPGRSIEQVCVLVARNRGGLTTDFIMPRFTVQAVDESLGPVIASDSLLCSDGSKVLASFATKRNLLHYAINASAGEHVALLGTVHVQNVNGYQSRLKEWMVRFHGVSTKWLPRYLGWWRMLDGRQSELTPDEILRYAIA